MSDDKYEIDFNKAKARLEEMFGEEFCLLNPRDVLNKIDDAYNEVLAMPWSLAKLSPLQALQLFQFIIEGLFFGN